jgi:hypothetical protein
MYTELNKKLATKISLYEQTIDSLTIDDFHKKLIKTNWLDQIELMEFLTKKHFAFYNILNASSIILIGITPLILIIDVPTLSKNIVVSTCSIISSIALTFISAYKYDDKWKHFRNIAEDLKLEGENYFELSSAYESYPNHSEAFKLFCSKVSDIKRKQINTYIKEVSQKGSGEKLELSKNK